MKRNNPHVATTPNTARSPEMRDKDLRNKANAILAIGVLTSAGLFAAVRNQEAPQPPDRSDYSAELLGPAEQQAIERARVVADTINSTIQSGKSVPLTLLNGYVKQHHPGSYDHELRYMQVVVLEDEGGISKTPQYVGVAGNSQKDNKVEIRVLEVKPSLEIEFFDPNEPFETVEVRALPDGRRNPDEPAFANSKPPYGERFSAFVVDPTNPEISLFKLGGTETYPPLAPGVTIPYN